MKNKPGISWGVNAPVNLLQSSKGFLAVDFYGQRKIVEVFNPKNIYEHHQMMKQIMIWNYGTCELCPQVRMEMDNEN